MFMRARFGKLLRGAARTARRMSFVRDALAAVPAEVVIAADNNINWIRYANAGMTHPGHQFCFDYVMKHLPGSAPILEVGSFCGLSTNLLIYYKRTNKIANKFFTCDNWSFGGARPDEGFPNEFLDYQKYRALVKDSFLRNVQVFSAGSLPHSLELSSSAFFDAWRNGRKATDLFGREVVLGGAFSFCFIDANHTYQGVKEDFENCAEFLQPGGFLLFDDSSDDSGYEGVQRLVREVQALGSYELVHRNPHHLFRKRR
jgi:hypothetical protein